ncbi:glycosyltransferase family 2 protein [Desulfovibrio sp. OttesenSCG-928-C14]|nr:glycosyltransferase family 2 protein [Desulfovibrio sp. OttesenSCG-928-C14]
MQITLNAIMCVWREEDIIGSTVRHAFAQGCSKVYILDNDSGDRTVQRAVRAGAVFLARFESKVFDETQKTVYTNKCVQSVNGALKDGPVWWLYLDADEFPDFGNGASILETLAGLPENIRAVRAVMLDHLPTHEPYFLPGFHPADLMPLAQRGGMQKTPLLRHDPDKPGVVIQSGAHNYHCAEKLEEARETLAIHHFNYRTQAFSKARLEALVLPDARGKSRNDWYEAIAALDNKERSQYRERLDRLDEVYAANRLRQLKGEALPYDYKKLIRWYDPLAFDLSQAGLPELDRLICEGSHLFYMEEYGRAATLFTRALELAEDEETARLLREALERAGA